MAALLKVENLKKHFYVGQGLVTGPASARRSKPSMMSPSR